MKITGGQEVKRGLKAYSLFLLSRSPNRGWNGWQELAYLLAGGVSAPMSENRIPEYSNRIPNGLPWRVAFSGGKMKGLFSMLESVA